MILEEILDAKNRHVVYFGKGVLSNTPDWSAFIRLMDKKFNNPAGFDWDEKLVKNKTVATDIMIYNKLDPVIFKAVECVDGQIVDHQIPEAQPFIDILSSTFKNFHLKAIINFVGNESNYWVHKDDHYVLSWGCIGKTEWRIYSDSNTYETYILEPGDIIFCPRDILHEVVITEPRASLIFQGFE